jgi:hypothetical protein
VKPVRHEALKFRVVDVERRLVERRRARRFAVDWNVSVSGVRGDGEAFEMAGSLRDLSSLGAFIDLPNRLEPLTTVAIQIRVPFERENWMSYRGEILRTESTDSGYGLAIRFMGSRPAFYDK